MSAIQQTFSLRVSSGVKSIHLLGSWDNYSSQLPLSKDKSASKSGSWKGTFRFSGATLEAGQRYWYYYIIDGYHVSHNPSEESTVEPTTGRQLNILDVPKAKSSSKSSSRHSSSSKSSKSSSRHSADIPKGRPLSVSQIKAPKPVNPSATRNIVEFDEEELSSRFAATGIYDDEYAEDIITDFSVTSPVSSVGSDLSFSSSSDMSGYSTPASDCSSCSCERYGITRKGDRVRIDCGGSRCGYDESCSSSSEDEEIVSRSSKRHGIVVRN
jgi:hypothetical protein